MRVLVNGETIVEDGELRARHAGPRAPHRQRLREGRVYYGDGKPVAIEDVRVQGPGPRRGARRDQGGRALPLRPERDRRHDPVPRAGRARARGRRRRRGGRARRDERQARRRRGHPVDARALRALLACEVGTADAVPERAQPEGLCSRSRRRHAGLPVREHVDVHRADAGARAERHPGRPARAVRPLRADRLRHHDGRRRGAEPRAGRGRRDAWPCSASAASA